QMARVQDELERLDVLGSEAVLLSFSTDPFRDTPEVLREYAERFAADPEGWRFLTGPPRAWIDTIQQGFALGVGYVDADGQLFDPFTSRPERYDVMHALNILLIDRDGVVRKHYVFPDFRLDTLLRDVRRAVQR